MITGKYQRFGGTWCVSQRMKHSKGQFTHCMPFPCHAVPLRVYNVSFPFDSHSVAMSDLHLPCHAPTMLLFSRPRHSASVERRPVGYLHAFSFFQLLCGVPRRLLSEAYQSQTQVASVKPNNVCHFFFIYPLLSYNLS